MFVSSKAKNIFKGNSRIIKIYKGVEKVYHAFTHKKTAGNEIVLSDSLKRPLDSLRIFGKSTQQTIPGNQLINFLDMEETEINGLKISCKDSVVTINGTCNSLANTATIGLYDNPSLSIGNYTISGGLSNDLKLIVYAENTYLKKEYADGTYISKVQGGRGHNVDDNGKVFIRPNSIMLIHGNADNCLTLTYNGTGDIKTIEGQKLFFVMAGELEPVGDGTYWYDVFFCYAKDFSLATITSAYGLRHTRLKAKDSLNNDFSDEFTISLASYVTDSNYQNTPMDVYILVNDDIKYDDTYYIDGA